MILAVVKVMSSDKTIETNERSKKEGRHLLFLSEPYPPLHPGGAGKYTQVLARGLAARGYQIDVVCIDPSHSSIEVDGNVFIQRIQVSDFGWSIKTFEERYKRILPILQKRNEQCRYDLVHDVGGFLYYEVFRDFIRDKSIKGITHLLLLMGPYLKAMGVEDFYVNLFHDLQYMQCMISEAVITTSTQENLLYRQLFVPQNKLNVMIFNGTDPPCPDPDTTRSLRSTLSHNDSIIFFMGGRISDYVKGGDRAVAFIKALRKKNLNVCLVVTNLRHSTDNKSLADYIIDLGRLEKNDFASLLAAVDFVLCPSRYEAFGLLAVEALSVGTPVIASAIGGHIDTIPKFKNGILLEVPLVMSNILCVMEMRVIQGLLWIEQYWKVIHIG